MSAITLARQIQELADRNGVILSEGDEQVLLSNVEAEAAAAVVAAVRALGWAVRVENNASDPDELDFQPEFAPFSIAITKPAIADRLRYLTLTGFSEWLGRSTPGVLQVALCEASFATELLVVQPWSEAPDPAPDRPLPARTSPAQFVRDFTNPKTVPTDLRPWLGTKDFDYLGDDPAQIAWRKAACALCVISVASEVNRVNEAVYVGRSKLQAVISVSEEPSRPTFEAVQELLRWAYDASSSPETRVRLTTNEISRLGRSGPCDYQSLLSYCKSAFEGAKLSFNYTLTKSSSDSEKALGDLRKSLSDDSAKISEITRQTITAAAGSIFASIGLIAARIVSDTPREILFFMSIVLFLYVLFVIKSGFDQLDTQRTIRNEWREILYKYLPAQDYKRLVLNPISESEGAFARTAAIAFIITLLMLIAVATFPAQSS